MTTPPLASSLRRTSLDSADSSAGVAWQLSPLTDVPAEWSAVGAAPIPATVPGEVYADLLAGGLIPDPFDGDNEDRLHWIGSTDWSYETSFTFADAGERRHDLVFAGLDTLATVVLNGVEIGRTANQHRSYRFDVTGALRDGENALQVRFEGPVTGAQRLSAELGDRPRAYAHPFNAIRKMAAGYGWDWGPDLAGVGIWKSVGIESWSGVRLGVGPSSGPGRGHIRSAGDPGRAGVGRRRRQPGRGHRHGRRPGRDGERPARPDRCRARADRPRRGAVVAAGLRRAAPLRREASRWRASPTPPRSASAPPSWSPPRTSTAPVSPWWSTARRSTSAASTGSPTTRCSPGSPRTPTAPRSTRPSPPGRTCCGSGAVASTRATTSTTSATSSGSWSGRTSCSPAPPTARMSRFAAR